jgi:hypothetical protein
MNTSVPSDTHARHDEAVIVFLQNMISALTKYVWIVPVAFGVPGNILTLLVANRKHNRKLSPCVYMSAMACADTVFLLEVMWYYSVFYQGLIDDLTGKSARGLIIRSVCFKIQQFISGSSVETSSQ